MISIFHKTLNYSFNVLSILRLCTVLLSLTLCLCVPAVGMEELQVIKKELTLIKTQIDGLLDSLDRMDTQRNDHKGETLIQEDSGGS